MYTNKFMRLHSKCLHTLELIRQCNNRSEDQRAKLFYYDHTRNEFAPIRLMNNREDIINQIERYKAIKGRLVSYYANTMEQLNKIVIEKIPA